MTPKRFDSVDFWRGMALIAIFVNHMPGNVLEVATPRNFGFSDSAEAFVFMAGFAGALAYGGKLERGQFGVALSGIARRVSLIYIIQVFLTFLAMALYSSAYKWGGAADILSIHDRDVFLQQPLESMIGVFLISNQIGYYNILPMYILFLAISPLLLVAANRSGLLLLAVSAAVYTAARVWNINLPTYPVNSTWFFNPFCWQLVYCLGLVTGGYVRRGGRVPLWRGLYWVAMANVVLSAIVVSNGLGTMPDLFQTVASHLDLTKTGLGLMRLADFLSLAYVIYVSRVTNVFKPAPLFRPVSLMGRNSLWVFAAGSILATIGQILMEVMRNTVLLDVAYAAFGVWILYLVAVVAQGARSMPASEPKGAALQLKADATSA